MMEISRFKTTALAVGSTSIIALIASTGQSLAEGLYMGLSLGSNNGANPAPGASSSPEDYEMGGSSVSGFVGIQHDLANGMFGGVELAWTGPTEGDVNEGSSYDYAYDTNYTLDAKARIGKHLGNVDVYGFGGLSTGSINGAYYGNDYRFNGVNVGLGAQLNGAGNMFTGIEYIHRFTMGEPDGDSYTSDHGTLSLRMGYKF